MTGKTFAWACNRSVFILSRRLCWWANRERDINAFKDIFNNNTILVMLVRNPVDWFFASQKKNNQVCTSTQQRLFAYRAYQCPNVG